MTEDQLDGDLAFLAENGYVTIDADAYLDAVRGLRPAPPGAVVLTFDDGALNLFEVAFPILRAHEMQAVAFICPGLHRTESEYARHAEGDRGGLPCSWEQIQEMHAAGVIDFQSHTLEHRYVRRWPEPADLSGCDPGQVTRLRGDPLPLQDDLREAKSILEGRLEKTIRHLAFPKYLGTEEAVDAGVECGYEGFWWGALPGSRARPGRVEPSHLPRLNDEWLRRLPGRGRRPLSEIVAQRASGSWGRYIRRNNEPRPRTNPMDGPGGGQQ